MCNDTSVRHAFFNSGNCGHMIVAKVSIWFFSFANSSFHLQLEEEGLEVPRLVSDGVLAAADLIKRKKNKFPIKMNLLLFFLFFANLRGRSDLLQRGLYDGPHPTPVDLAVVKELQALLKGKTEKKLCLLKRFFGGVFLN